MLLLINFLLSAHCVQVFSFSEISHLKAYIIKLEKSCKSLSTSTQLYIPKPITGSSISDITVKSTATSSMSSSSMSSQPVPSNSHPSKCHPISPNPAHLIISSVRSNPSLPSKFLNKPPCFLSQARPPHLSFQFHVIINILQLTKCLFFQLFNHLNFLSSSLIFIHHCNFQSIQYQTTLVKSLVNPTISFICLFSQHNKIFILLK